MIDQLMDSYRKASASWLQMQQDAFRQLAQQWLTTPQGPAGMSAEWSRSFQKRWLELAIEALNKHRESLDAVYTSGHPDDRSDLPRLGGGGEVHGGVPAPGRGSVAQAVRQLQDPVRDPDARFPGWAEKSMAIVQKPARPSVEQYLEFWRQAAAVGRGSLAAASMLLDPRPLRNMWVAHLTQVTDRFLRSPECLELMKHSLRVLSTPGRPRPLP